MADYVYLQGSSEVERAGHQMARAAHEMQQAASNIDAALTNHQRFLEDWLDRFAVLMAKSPIAISESEERIIAAIDGIGFGG